MVIGRAPVVGPRLVALYRKLQQKAKRVAAEARDLFEPQGITPNGLGVPVPEKYSSQDRIKPTPIQIQFASAMGTGGGDGPLDLETLLWRFVSGEAYALADPVIDAIEEGRHTVVVKRFLDQALNDRVVPKEKFPELAAAGFSPAPDLMKYRFSENALVINLATRFYCQQKDWDNTIKYAKKSLTKFGKPTGQEDLDAMADYNAWIGEGYYRKAEAGRKQEPQHPQTQKWFREARQYFVRNLATKPKAVNNYGILMNINYHLGKHGENEKLVREAIRAHGGSPPITISYDIWHVFFNAIVNAKRRNSFTINMAVAHFERVQEDLESLPAADQREGVRLFAHMTGIAYCLRGDYNKAIQWIRDKANWETDAQFVYYMAYAQQKTGNFGEAKRLAGVLRELDPNYDAAKLRSMVFPEEAKAAAAPRPVPKPSAPPEPQRDPYLISGEEVRVALLGEKSANVDHIFTADRITRQAVTNALEEVVGQYVGFIQTEGWETVQEMYLSEPVTLAIADPKLKPILEILGIDKIEIHPSDSREVRLYLSGQTDKYYTIRITDELGFEFFEKPALRELEVLLKAVILEEIVALIEGGTSFAEVMAALKTRPAEAPSEDPIEWVAVGRQAKAEREAAVKAAAAAAAEKAVEEARLLAELEKEQGITSEKAFLGNNQGVYSALAFELDESTVNLAEEEIQTDSILATCLTWLASSRMVDAPVYSFEETVSAGHPLFPLIRKVTMYGTNRAREILAAKDLRMETIEQLGFVEQPARSPFLGVYDLECEIAGETRVLTAVLDGSGRNLVVLGLEKTSDDPLLTKTLKRVVLERLTYKTASVVKDAYGTEAEEPGLTTERRDLLRGIAVILELQFSPGGSRRKASVGSLGNAAEFVELARIASQPGGLAAEPLYTKVGGKYRRVRSDHRRYMAMVRRAPDKRFVRMRPGLTFRLRLGPMNTPAGAPNATSVASHMAK